MPQLRLIEEIKMTKILYARPIRDKIILDLENRTKALKEKKIVPWLRVILVGDDPASQIYTKNKKKFVEKMGGKCDIIRIEKTIEEGPFRELINNLTSDNELHGLLIQLPLPNHLSHIDVGNLIPSSLDVDGLNSINIGELVKNNKAEKPLCPCTPKGIVTLLQYYNIPLKGKNICILGRSLIVGRPLSTLLTNYNATVTLCHSHTKNIQEYTQRADIIITAIGTPHFLTQKFINETKNQVLIDVGINTGPNGKLCGDINFDDVYDKVAAITPVPGGVGPMTILSLAQNLLQAAENSL